MPVAEDAAPKHSTLSLLPSNQILRRELCLLLALF